MDTYQHIVNLLKESEISKEVCPVLSDLLEEEGYLLIANHFRMGVGPNVHLLGRGSCVVIANIKYLLMGSRIGNKNHPLVKEIIRFATELKTKKLCLT